MAKSQFSKEDLNRWKKAINPGPVVGSRLKLRRENSEYVGLCPFHPDKNPSFKIWKLSGGVWNLKCFGCGWDGNIFQFVQKYDSSAEANGISEKTANPTTFVQAVSRVLAEAGYTEDGVQTEAQEDFVEDSEPKEYITFSLPEFQPAIDALEHSPEGKKWLRERGISMEAARRMRLGFLQSAEKVTKKNTWMNDGWILFPTFASDDRTITAVKYRSVVAKKAVINGQANSGILRALNTSTTLYNLQAVKPSEDVWLVEGEPDALVLTQAGKIAVGWPSGSYHATPEEYETLNTAKRRFIAGDNPLIDSVGKQFEAELSKSLTKPTFSIIWPNNHKDANAVLTDECGNNAKKFQSLLEDLENRATQTEDEVKLRKGSEVRMKRIKWLWENKIPLGKITLFAGNPDNGKSLASTRVAALVTNGMPFPDETAGRKPANVLMLIGEDDIDDTAAPRLRGAEADMDRVYFLDAVRPVRQEDREVRLDIDIPAIERRIDSIPDGVKLVIVDPISNYLGKVSMVAEQEARSILIPLKRLAEKYNCAVLLVMHLNKKNDLEAISRVGGAMAFIGVARCSWLFVRNQKETPEGEEDTTPKELDDKTPDTFSMLRIKNNLVSSNRSGMSYTVKTRFIPMPEGSDMSVPYVDWGTAIEGSADEALGSALSSGRKEPVPGRGVGRPNEKLQRAITWLQEQLQDGLPHATKILRRDAKESAGIASETLDRAKDSLPVKHSKVGKDWYWQIVPAGEPEAEEVGTTSVDFDFDAK